MTSSSDTPKVSIIVPAYNNEVYLRDCLESLVNQSLKEIEIIVVNDGSTDSTEEILAEFAERDSRVRVVSQPNAGYGVAMNRGLDLARGTYVGILESDDYADQEMFRCLYDLAEEHSAEVVKADYCDLHESLGKTIPKGIFQDRLEVLEKPVNPQNQPFLFLLPAAIWSAIYRRDFLQEHDIRFLETPGASYQDLSFNFKVWAQATCVVLTNKPFVYYRRDNEASSIKSKAKIFCICDENDEIRRFMDQHGLHTPANVLAQARVLHDSYMWNINRLAWRSKWVFFQRLTKDFATYLPADLLASKGSTFTLMERWFVSLCDSHPLVAFFVYVLGKFNIIKVTGGNAIRVKVLGLRVYKRRGG